MIPCQRHLFNIPDDVAYFNCAFTAPLLRDAEQAGYSSVREKVSPWTITSKNFFMTIETLRDLFSQLVGCTADDVALIPAVSYGIALAAKNLPVSSGQTIIVLADQFPSNIYAWRRLADEKNASIITVQRPEDKNWTRAVVQAVDDNTAVVAVPNCHWTDGTLLDLVQIGEKCRTHDAALVVDGIQSLGAMPFSVSDVRPDFLVTAAHKWLLGPYSMGYCYVSPRWQKGTPLEENWLNRNESENFARLVDYRDEYQPGARRFDVGEASNFILSPIAEAALRQILDWGIGNIADTLRAKTDAISEWAVRKGFDVSPASARVPHMLGLAMPGGFSHDLPARIAQDRVYVSVRGNSIRVAPHLYINETDMERLFNALEKI
ncbi:aminotransferase class V-fold PLP-dependent enzyme [Desulfococcaceae bacterium HSG8]|nr:aminotransferase class V-fold PLP-dependent enzyme [Desulfococcaceae bacterium HSG8]